MNANRITQVHVYIIGAVLAVIVGVGLYYGLIKPIDDQNKVIAGEVEQIKSSTISVDGTSYTSAQYQAATEKLKAAQARTAASRARLQETLRNKSLPASEAIRLNSDDSLTRIDQKTVLNWFLLPRHVVQRMQTYAERSAAKDKVVVSANFSAPAPSTNPSAIPNDVIAWTMGDVTVSGEFNRVLKWIEDWNKAPLLTSVDGLKLTVAGPGGRVIGTARINCYILPTGSSAKIPAEGGSPAAAPGGGGGFGGGGGNGFSGGGGNGFSGGGGNGPMPGGSM